MLFSHTTYICIWPAFRAGFRDPLAFFITCMTYLFSQPHHCFQCFLNPRTSTHARIDCMEGGITWLCWINFTSQLDRQLSCGREGSSELPYGFITARTDETRLELMRNSGTVGLSQYSQTILEGRFYLTYMKSAILLTTIASSLPLWSNMSRNSNK